MTYSIYDWANVCPCVMFHYHLLSKQRYIFGGHLCHVIGFFFLFLKFVYVEVVKIEVTKMNIKKRQ